MANRIRIRNDRVEYCTERICELLKINPKTLTRWEKDGCPKAARGWWDLESVLVWKGVIGDNGVKSPKEMESMSLQQRKLHAEVAWKEAQSELIKLKTEITCGVYLKRTVVQEDYRRFFVEFKRFALSIPHMVSGIIAAYLEPAESRRIEKDLNGQICKMLKTFVVSGNDHDEKS